MWAHAEYVKLLRSAVDGRVFDRISVVEERYGVPREKRTFKSEIEFFQVTRPVTELPAGKRLQVLDRERFRVVWTIDNWQTKHTTEARLIGYPGFAVELPIPVGATGTLELTLNWPLDDRWLGTNHQVRLSES